MSLRQARFDVYKFGIKGLNKDEQENAKVQLAIKLGAKVNIKTTKSSHNSLNHSTQLIFLATKEQIRKLQGNFKT